jgi:MFS family permease
MTAIRLRLTGIAVGWLPPEQVARRLLIVSFIDSLGTGMFLTGSALFFTRAIGLSVRQVGFGLSLASVIGFCCSVPAGKLSDRVGARPVLVGLQFWRGSCFIAYPFVHDFPAFLVVAALAGAGEWAAPPVVQSLVGSLVADKSRVRTMSAVMMVRNVGFTLGAATATTAIAAGHTSVYRLLVFGYAATFLISGTVLWFLRIQPRSAEPDGQAPGSPGTESVPHQPRRRPGPRYLVLAALNGVLYLHAVILSVGLPLWVVTATKGPPALLGLIVVLNTFLAVSLQMRLSRGVDGVQPAAARQLRGGVCLAVCCLLVAVTASTDRVLTVVLVLAAVIMLTTGEVYQAVGGWGLSFELSPQVGRGYFLSVYSLGSTGAMIVGPWLLTSVIIPGGRVGWAGLAAVLIAAGACVPLLARGARPLLPLSEDQMVAREDHDA